VDHEIPADEIWNQLRFWSEQYLDSKVNRTRKFHELIDAKIKLEVKEDELEGYSPCFCHKGCSNCCYQPTACTDEEAQLIYNYCRDKGIDIDFEKLERQLRYIVVDSSNDFYGKTTWNNQPEQDQSCVFLDNGICTIWDVRPFVCRVHLVEKTNEFCKSNNGVPNPDARGIHYPICSYILSSIFTIHHDSIGKLMGRLLLQQKLNAELF
jgi:Fe-S-cluster containining protein